jgi:Saxitoxin biosynthesis operon protein SxtJ
MALFEINKNPSRRELLWFGVALAAFCGVVGALLRWRFGAPGAARAVWIAGAAIAALYYALPPIRRAVYLGWTYASWPIGWVVSHVILGITWYLVITPTGLVMRMLGHDPMRRRFDREAPTYWTPHRERDGGWFSQF